MKTAEKKYNCSGRIYIAEAAEVIKNNGVIVYPTETVYGLGCGMFSPGGVTKIYQLKDRPANLPLSINLHSIGQAREYAEIPSEFYILAEHFLPGPLAIIVKKRSIVPEYINSGYDTVAFRFPDNKCLIELLKLLDAPLVGTSANISGKESAKSGREAADIFGDEIDYLLDDGPADIGIESTIVDLSGKPKILRQGAIRKEDIEQFIDLD